MPIGPHDGIAVITIDHPPVNALGPQAIAPVLTALAAAVEDSTVHAIVLTGAGGTFSGGADMKNFGIVPAPRPYAMDLIDALESSPKPIVAALEGPAMGGGLEVALACDFRIAAPSARLAFPEIKRGLLPGAGGTQRAPRLTGAKAALELILGGDPIDGARAKAIGLVDEVASAPLEAAVVYAKTLGTARRRASEMTAQRDDEAIEAARKRAQPEARGGLAEQRAIDCVADALTVPVAQGVTRERERFTELVGSEQSKARIHLFFAEREAAKLGDGSVPAPFRVRTATIVGGGTMGTGIAMACANAGISVTLVDVQPDNVERARGIIGGNYAATMTKGRLTQAEMDQRMQLIRYSTSLDAAADVDLVIEAVFEEMAIKQDVFRSLDRIARPGTILASNTSTLDIDAIAGVTARPQDVIGMHFFSPANVMKLLEIVRGSATSPQTIAHALGFAKQIKKVGVVVGNCDGFVGNRMLYPYRREADFLNEEGATPERIDRVIKDFGLAMGPFAMGDLAGLDVGWRIRKRKYAEAPPVGRYSKVADVLCEMGRYGQKTGAGFYTYAEGSRTPIPDPMVDELVDRLAREAGIERRDVSDREILERCMFPLVNEAAKILAEGIASRPGDIDVVWVYGYGFPAFRGGPMRWAESVGLATIVDKMRAYEKVHGDAWAPAPLLVELAERGATFGSWKPHGAVAHA
ncbi:MAG: 3-hydroxyacyl-CoA dehydrogenase NAD-binding domain-containing protein [Candidatus Elarobacter sp.]